MDIMKDVATVTTIPLATLKAINIKSIECIGHQLLESYSDEKCSCCLDIGIGELLITICDKDVSYQFIPSEKLKETVNDVIEENKDPLLNAIEDALVTKLNNAYKEFF